MASLNSCEFKMDDITSFEPGKLNAGGMESYLLVYSKYIYYLDISAMRQD